MLRRPYDEQPGREAFAAPPPRLGARPRRLLDAVVQLVSTSGDSCCRSSRRIRRAPALQPVPGRVVLSVAGRRHAALAAGSVLGDRVPFATFFIAIVLAVQLGGLGASVLTMLIGHRLGAGVLVSRRPAGPVDLRRLPGLPGQLAGDHAARPADAEGRGAGRGARA